MKAKPVKRNKELQEWEQCEVSEATHIHLLFPTLEKKSSNTLVLPIVPLTPNSICWNWNGDCESPTLSPSIKTYFGYKNEEVCHSFIKNGNVEYLSDCTHEYKNQILPLLSH